MAKAIAALLTGAALGAGGAALARPAADVGSEPTVKPLSAVDVKEKLAGEPARATTFEVTFAPGAASPPHRHPGPIFGYVLEGEFEFQAGGRPLRRLKAGETFYEPTMALHAVGRNPGAKETTRVLAVLLHPRDAEQLVIPEPPGGGA